MELDLDLERNYRTITDWKATFRKVTTLVEPSIFRKPPPMMAPCLVSYLDAQASISYSLSTFPGSTDMTRIIGRKGTLISSGPSLHDQRLTLFTDDGRAEAELDGSWFPDGFLGAMAEFLSSIEENRVNDINPLDSLENLALSFAAIGSANTGNATRPWQMKNLSL